MQVNTSVKIRKAVASDAKMLSELSVKTFYDTFGSMNSEDDMQLYLSKNLQQEHIESELENTRTVFLIVESGKEAVGYAKMGRTETPAGLAGTRAMEVERLYVLEEFHGQKIGTALMKACISHAMNDGSDILWLGVWEHNARAIAFYEDFGFKQFGEHPFVLGTDVQTDWMMMIDLGTRSARTKDL